MVSLKPLAEQVIVITGASSENRTVVSPNDRAGGRPGGAGGAQRGGAPSARGLDQARGRRGLCGAHQCGRRRRQGAPGAGGGAAVRPVRRLVNPAGVSIFGRVMDVSTRNMRRMFETNFRSVACGLRAAARVQDRLEPGAPIARGSVPGERATPFPSTDAASASAVQASRMGFLAR